ncbi:MAG: EAL domain-containing protein [Spirochaetes bacterium]|nr:EAL domain-containing protein [Spirochaetota bacterium]
MSNEKILIVEDEKIIALDLQRRLERFGFNVVGMAGRREDALNLAATMKPDIVLMDISLAGQEGANTDGIEVALIIKKTLGIPIIFLTAHAGDNFINQAKHVEPAGYILKPFKERELYTTIDIALYKHAIEKRLHKQERLFSAILHTINDGIISVDVALVVEFMNPIAEDVLGYKEAELRGRVITQVLTLFDPKQGKDIFGGGIPLIDEQPLYFHDVVIKNQAGDSVIVDGSVSRIHEEDNATDGFVIAFRDMTEIKRLSDNLNYWTSHDNLTGLANREEFSFKLSEILKGNRGAADSHALAVIDVDRFKAVNDAYGSTTGDELLKRVANNILSNIQRHDMAARIGGDDFAVLLFDCEPVDAVNVAKRLQEAVLIQESRQQSMFPISLSIGIVPLDRLSGDIHSVLAAADDACRVSKEEGGNKITIFNRDDSMFRQRRGQMEWIGKLNAAVEENKFVLYYQPIVPLDKSKGLDDKLEVLIRLVNDDGTIASPVDFIPAAERYNLMPMVDKWVIRNVMKNYRTLSDAGSPLADSVFCVNLSGQSLLDESLIDVILGELAANRLPAERFCFEITETAAIQNLSYASRFIKRLREHGFSFALDDFGSGSASFGYLKNFEAEYVKIDGSFIQGIDENIISYTMVKSIHDLVNVMGLKTIGEFVKNEGIKLKLQEIGVDYGQGYFFAAPKPLLPR